MSISSDEVNFLIYRYLQENGFGHSAFTFAYESLVIKSSMAQTEIPPGALITFLQKGLEYIAIEEHINEDGSIQEFENNYSLLSPLICEAVAVKEDRRVRRVVPTSTTSSSAAGSTGENEHSGAMDTTGAAAMEEAEGDRNGSSGAVASRPATALVSTMTPSSVQMTVNDSNTMRFLQLSGHRGEIFSCTWNPSNDTLATGSSDGVARLWELGDMDAEKWASEKGAVVKLSTAILPHCVSEGEKFRDVTSISWSPDGKLLATGCYDGTIRIWSRAGKLALLLKEHTGPVFSLKWHKSGSLVLSGSYDQRSIVWSVRTGSIVQAFFVHSAPVLDVDWRNGPGYVFASCSSDRTIKLCAVDEQLIIAASNATTAPATFPITTTPLCSLAAHDDEINAIAWSPAFGENALLASCSDDSTAKIWCYSPETTSTSANGDSRSVTADGKARQLQLKSVLQGHSKVVFALKWTPGGPNSANQEAPLQLCTASFDGTVKLWSDAGIHLLDLCKQVQPVYSIAPSPNGKFVATGSLGGNVSIWSAKSGHLVMEIQGTGDTFDVSWSSDSKMLSSCFSSGQVYVLQAAAATEGMGGDNSINTASNDSEAIITD